ncbi:MAG TPA: hypothetical protein VLS51_06940 [Propionibacteriaceae bacterium]|nr:hypothetical protein [Propionibacteriaceae bacterium]
MREEPEPWRVEMLEEWDDDVPDGPRRSRSWIVAPVALLVLVLGIVAVVANARPSAVEHVAPSLAASDRGTSASQASAPATGEAPPAVTRSTASASPGRVAVQLPAVSSDDPVQPLRVSLLDPAPAAPSPGLIAYRVQVCVSDDSAGVASDTVTVRAANWSLASYGRAAAPSSGVPGVAPQFPFESRLGKGQCASGYVTFAWNVVEPADVLSYDDSRFGWSWRLT